MNDIIIKSKKTKFNKDKLFFINNKSNDVMPILKRIGLLPDELIKEIYLYLPQFITIFLNKDTYIKEHQLTKNYIKNYELYIRNIVKRDYDYTFSLILNENYIKWSQMTNYLYNNILYTNYIYFLLYFCNENSSFKCREKIIYLLNKHGLSKNQHKKKSIKYNNGHFKYK